jgi:septal ring factor EnvC (AmiA/AmiB activator)
MAQGRDEHRMVFDIRGRRRHVVKFVYAILAVLMGLSLFLVTGAINVGSIFGTTSSGESAVSNFEDQAAAIEKKLAKTPADEDLLASLTRTRINTANAMITNGAGESQSGVEEIQQELAQASEDWTKYVKASEEPSPGVAIQVSPALFQLAEISTTGPAALENVKAATEAQEVVADARPSLNSLSTLAIYQLFAQDYKGAKESTAAATKLASSKVERETIENKIEETEKNAKTFGKSLKAEEVSKSESAGKETLEKPFQGLGTPGLGG